jgi:hypothetical protein
MADFFSQFQVHPPGDFNLGGFQQQVPQSSGPMGTEHGYGTSSNGDPRLSPLPQPWQQGPISGPSINGGNAQLPPNDFPNLGGVSPQMPSLGPAANMGPNGPTFTNGQGQSTDQFGTPLANGIGQPMNPSQQSGMVLMRSPDGLHMQNVPQAHVDHYTGLGATQVTGPQLTGSSYGGSV